MEILDSLIQIRKEKKVFQKDLLKTLGINSTTLSRYEKGKREIPFKIAAKYAECLGYELKLQKK